MRIKRGGDPLPPPPICSYGFLHHSLLRHAHPARSSCAVRGRRGCLQLPASYQTDGFRAHPASLGGRLRCTLRHCQSLLPRHQAQDWPAVRRQLHPGDASCDIQRKRRPGRPLLHAGHCGSRRPKLHKHDSQMRPALAGDQHSWVHQKLTRGVRGRGRSTILRGPSSYHRCSPLHLPAL